jgi:hypothetical protein
MRFSPLNEVRIKRLGKTLFEIRKQGVFGPQSAKMYGIGVA